MISVYIIRYQCSCIDYMLMMSWVLLTSDSGVMLLLLVLTRSTYDILCTYMCVYVYIYICVAPDMHMYISWTIWTYYIVYVWWSHRRLDTTTCSERFAMPVGSWLTLTAIQGIYAYICYIILMVLILYIIRYIWLVAKM